MGGLLHLVQRGAWACPLLVVAAHPPTASVSITVLRYNDNQAFRPTYTSSRQVINHSLFPHLPLCLHLLPYFPPPRIYVRDRYGSGACFALQLVG